MIKSLNLIERFQFSELHKAYQSIKKNLLLVKLMVFKKRNLYKYRLTEVSIVPKVGIEPTRPKTHEFESCASTSSATSAFYHKILVDLSANLLIFSTRLSCRFNLSQFAGQYLPKLAYLCHLV